MNAHRRSLGRNGPPVTAIGLGLAGVSIAYGKPLSEEKTIAFSDAYGDNSERLKRYFDLTGSRDKVFLASKVGIQRVDGTVKLRGDPAYVREATERLLDRLGLPSVDLLYMHRLDRDVPVEHTVSTMAELVNEGKARYIGLSECSASSLRRAYAVHPISAVQVEYSPFSLDIEDPRVDLLRTCRELGVAVVAYSPLGRGMLAGRIRSRADLEPGDARLAMPRYSQENFPKNLELVKKLQALADRKGVTVGQLTLAWVLAQGQDIVPIPGTTDVARLEENMGALDVTITDDEAKDIRLILRDISGMRYAPGIMAESQFVDTPPL